MIDGTIGKYLQEGQGNSDGRFRRALRTSCQRLHKEDDLRRKLDLVLAGVLSGMCIPKDQRGLNSIHILIQQLLRNTHGKEEQPGI